MDVRTFLYILILSVLIERNVSQYYGNNYYPNMGAPMAVPMPAPVGPRLQQVAMPRPMPGPIPGPMPGRVQGPVYSDEYDDDDQPRFRRRNSGGKLPSIYDTDYDDPRALPPPPNIVLVPYPYALVVPNLLNLTSNASKHNTTEKITSEPTTITTEIISESTTITPTTTTTTRKPTTEPTTEKPAGRNFNIQEYRPENYRLDDRRKEDARLEHRRLTDSLKLAGLRPEGPRPEDIKYMSLRKTKPTWLPKYGIVPIPDNLAEKLMSQLRDVKAMQPNTRRIISQYGQYGLI